MLRVSTIYAATANATANYYTQYLTKAPGERRGAGMAARRPLLGLAGEVTTHALELLLTGRDPSSGHRSVGHSSTRSAPTAPSSGRWPGSTRRSRRRSRCRCGGRSPATAGSLEAHDVAVQRRARAPGAVRVDDPHPLERRPAAPGHERADDGDVPPDHLTCR